MTYKTAINVAYKKGRAEGINFTAENYSAVILLCLKDKFDFDTKQLLAVKKHINDAFDSICTGYLTLPDIINTLHEENSIDIKFEKELREGGKHK